MIKIVTKQIVVRTRRFQDTWNDAPNEMLIKVLEMGFQVVMANPIGNELEYILEKSFSEDKYKGEPCPDKNCNVTDTNVENIQYPDDMDKECIPLCDLFNVIGLKTQFSCCGHGDAPFKIIFEDSVTDEKMCRFIELLSQTCNYTPIIGAFLKWTRKVDDEIASNWTYQVDKIEWADCDLKSIKEYMGDVE